MSLKGGLRLGLLATFSSAAILLTMRAYWGPLALVRSPLNVESVAAVSLMILWGMSSFQTQSEPRGAEIPTRWALAALVSLVLVAFWRSLGYPLIFDDYVNIPAALHATPSFWIDQWTVPAADRFFRPLAMYDYRIDSFFAGHSAFLWRLGNLIWNITNSVLVFFLAQRLGLKSWTALIAALIFGIHGARTESAAWVAGRFDLLATCFILTSLLCFYRANERKATAYKIAALLTGIAALLSKEAAYMWPLLVTLLFWRKLSNRLLIATYALTAATFLYRWHLLNGIGGYQTGEQADIFTFSLARTIKALAWREWAVLSFPINWTHSPEGLLCLSMIAALAAYAWLAWKGAALHWPALAFVLIASLPVQHLLLIGQDLEKSRILYLPSVGFAILIGYAIQSTPQLRGSILAGAAIILFQLAALEHNLNIAGRVAEVGREACFQAGQAAVANGGTISVAGLPKLRDGVYFLGNGFPQCVEWHTGVAADRVHVFGSSQDSGAATSVLRWNDSTDRFVAVPR